MRKCGTRFFVWIRNDLFLQIAALFQVWALRSWHVYRPNWKRWFKPVNVFPVTSPAMVIAITKRKKSRETNREKWGKALSRSQLTKFTLMSIYELWRKGLWENGDQKAGLSSQNTANLANLDMGHPPEIYSYGIYLNSQIFGTLQYAKFGEKIIVIRRRFVAKIFLRLNVNKSWISCMRYAQINAQCKIFSHWARYFKMTAVVLGICIMRSMVSCSAGITVSAPTTAVRYYSKVILILTWGAVCCVEPR